MSPSRRARSYLERPPSDPNDLAGFPAKVLRAGTRLHRVHSAVLGAWYFNPDATWRFNPTGSLSRGACYFAERPVAGLLESYKGFRMVDEKDVATKAHFIVELEEDLRLADCCAMAAGDFGVNGEIHTTTDYDLTQEWASSLDDAGFAGIRYYCRSDPSLRLVGFALFDAAGAAPAGGWPAGSDRPVSDAVIAEAEGYGLRIRPTP